MRIVPVLILVFAILALGAENPDEFIRQANTAFESGELETAEKLYSQAEARTADPGLIAFNRGVMLFRQGQFREAENQFRRTLGDGEISSERRTRAWFNLGVCQLKQVPTDDVKQLRSVVASFENALEESQPGSTLHSDIRYNLELSRLFWQRANAKKSPESQAEPNPPEAAMEKKEEKKAASPKNDKVEEGKDSKGKKLEKSDAKLDSKAKDPQKSDEPAKKKAGPSVLPVLKDDSKVEPLSPEETRALLKRTEDRLAKERRGVLREAAKITRFNDW